MRHRKQAILKRMLKDEYKVKHNNIDE